MYSSYHEELTRRLAAQVWNDEEARHLPIDFKLVGAIARKFISYVAAVEPDPTPAPVVENMVVDAAPELVPLELCTGETVLVTGAQYDAIAEESTELPPDFAMPTGEAVNLREYVDTLQATDAQELEVAADEGDLPGGMMHLEDITKAMFSDSVIATAIQVANEADIPPVPEVATEPVAEAAAEVAADTLTPQGYISELGNIGGNWPQEVAKATEEAVASESKIVEMKELLYGENPVASEAPAEEAQPDTTVAEPEAAPLQEEAQPE